MTGGSTVTSPGSFSTPGHSAKQSGEGHQPLEIVASERPASKLTLNLLAFYAFVIISRVLDLSPLWWMRIPLISLILLALFTLMRGELRFVFSSKITRFFAAFTAWVVFSAPFSIWRGASLDSVRNAVESFAFFIAVVQIVRTEAHWRKMANAYAYAILVASIFAFIYGRYIEGRLSLVGGTLADPNDLALTLLVGLPLWWLKASSASPLRKPLFWLCTVPAYVVFLRTGSRAGLLAFGTILLVTFVLSNPAQKVLIVIVAAVGIAVVGAFLPAYLRARYFTLFTPTTAEGLSSKAEAQLGSDIASSEGRKELLLQSIHMTLEHPVFGVGPGVFSYAAWDERKASKGEGGIALVTHNTYTQISSETGIPGFIFFVAAVYLSVKYTIQDYRIAKSKGLSVAKLPRYFFLSFSGLTVGIFFLSMGYTQMPVFFLALAASLHNVVRRSLSESHDQTTPTPLVSTALPPVKPSSHSTTMKGPVPRFLGYRNHPR